MSTEDIDTVRDGFGDGLSLSELEERLETQHAPIGAAALWACTPVKSCDIACGGGALCEFDCACHGLCQCEGALCIEKCLTACGAWSVDG